MHYGFPAKVKPMLFWTEYFYKNKSEIPCWIRAFLCYEINDNLSNLMLNYPRKRDLWGFLSKNFAVRPDKCGVQKKSEGVETRNMNAHQKWLQWQLWKYRTLTHCNTILFIKKKLAFSISLLTMPVWVAFKTEQDPTPTKHLCVFPCCEILWPMQAVSYNNVLSAKDGHDLMQNFPLMI